MITLFKNKIYRFPSSSFGYKPLSNRNKIILRNNNCSKRSKITIPFYPSHIISVIPILFFINFMGYVV